MTYNTIAEIKAANKAQGGHWFDAETVNYHRAKVETDVIGGFYFVESQHEVLADHDSPRVFRAVAASPTGDIQYLSGGDKFDTVGEAETYIANVVAAR